MNGTEVAKDIIRLLDMEEYEVDDIPSWLAPWIGAATRRSNRKVNKLYGKNITGSPLIEHKDTTCLYAVLTSSPDDEFPRWSFMLPRWSGGSIFAVGSVILGSPTDIDVETDQKTQISYQGVYRYIKALHHLQDYVGDDEVDVLGL
jgi:hypothetical protein